MSVPGPVTQRTPHTAWGSSGFVEAVGYSEAVQRPHLPHYSWGPPAAWRGRWSLLSSPLGGALLWLTSR